MTSTTTTVKVVFDMESEGGPFPIGTFVRTDEDAVVYRSTMRSLHYAPVDYVKIVAVEV